MLRLKVKTKGVCHLVQLLMQGIKFMVELNAIPFWGCEVVLGTQWLCTLGVIKWDFKLLTMQFTYSGKQVMLKGCPT